MAVGIIPNTNIESKYITSNGITFYQIKTKRGFMMYAWNMNITANENAPRYFNKRGTVKVTYPEAFAETAWSFASVTENAGWWNAQTINHTATDCDVAICGDSNTTKEVSCIAIGLWKAPERE